MPGGRRGPGSTTPARRSLRKRGPRSTPATANHARRARSGCAGYRKPAGRGPGYHCERRRHWSPGSTCTNFSRISVYDPVVGLGTSLTDSTAVHPTKRFTLAAFVADLKVSVILEDIGCRIFNCGIGRRIGKTLGNHPCVNRCGRPIPSNLTDEDLDFLLRPLACRTVKVSMRLSRLSRSTASCHIAARGHGRTQPSC